MIRGKITPKTALVLMLSFSLMLFPLASWGLFDNTMQTTSHTDDAIEMNASAHMTNCDYQPKFSNQENCDSNCCDNVESNHNCNDCPNSCASLVFFSLESESFNQFTNSHSLVQSLQSTVSSRKTSPPFRPPIAFLS